jgi:glucokinase
VSSDPVLGVALGAGRLIGVLGSRDELGDPNHKAIPFEGGTPEQVVEAVLKMAEDLSGEEGTETASGISSIGAALPGHVDHAGGKVVYGYKLGLDGASWHNEEFAALLGEAFGVPAVIDNDVNCMVLYQHEFGLGRGEPSFVTIYLASDMGGLGSGILIDGKIVRGCVGGAGEFGHLVVQPGGPRCPCGNRGCLEAVVGVDTIRRNVNWGERSNVKDLAGAALLAQEGDPRARDTFRQAGRFFGQGLAALVNLINPPLVIIGGPPEIVGLPRTADSSSASIDQALRRRVPTQRRRRTIRSAQLFREGYQETLKAYSFAKLEDSVEIAIGSLTLEMAAVGAAILGLESQQREPAALNARG